MPTRRVQGTPISPTNQTYPGTRKARFERWFLCDRCGIPWPQSMLRRQFGMLVCPEDYDALSHEDYMRKDAQPENIIKPAPWFPDTNPNY